MTENLLSRNAQNLYAMSEVKGKKDNAFVIVLLDGQLIADIQDCNSCKPKRVMLSEIGSSTYIAPKDSYRIRNNQMVKAKWLEIERED